MGPAGQKVLTTKLIFKNNIGRTLYDGAITKQSKMRRVPEKVHKNQLKVAVLHVSEDTKKPAFAYCKINFQRVDDLAEFEKAFQAAVDELKVAFS